MKKLLQFFEKHFLLADTLKLTLICCLISIVLQKTGKQDFLNFVFDNKEQLYPLFFNTGITLLGFLMTGISIILIFLNDERLILLRESGHFKSILGIYINTILVTAVFTILGFLGLVLKSNDLLKKLSLVIEAVILIEAIRIWRCIWIIEEVSKILYKKTKPK